MQNNFNHLFGLLNEVYNILTNETHNNTCSVFFLENGCILFGAENKNTRNTRILLVVQPHCLSITLRIVVNLSQIIPETHFENMGNICVFCHFHLFCYLLCARTLSLSLSPLSLRKLSTEFRAGALSFRV